MGNISLDFSNESIVYPNKKENTSFTYKDVGTSNFRFYEKDGKSYVNDIDSSNIDLQAVRASLNNLFNFKAGERILDPEFGIQKIIQMIYLPFDKHTTQKMINTLKDVISKYEPRIIINSMPTTYNEDKQEFHMTINYSIVDLGINDVYELSLQR